MPNILLNKFTYNSKAKEMLISLSISFLIKLHRELTKSYSQKINKEDNHYLIPDNNTFTMGKNLPSLKSN